MEVQQNVKDEEARLENQYFWVESVRHERLHEIQTKLKKPGKVFDAINYQDKVAHDPPD
jgi:hypothetical protein